jgi:hypothetical protein
MLSFLLMLILLFISSSSSGCIPGLPLEDNCNQFTHHGSGSSLHSANAAKALHEHANDFLQRSRTISRGNESLWRARQLHPTASITASTDSASNPNNSSDLNKPTNSTITPSPRRLFSSRSIQHHRLQAIFEAEPRRWELVRPPDPAQSVASPRGLMSRNNSLAGSTLSTPRSPPATFPARTANATTADAPIPSLGVTDTNNNLAHWHLMLPENNSHQLTPGSANSMGSVLKDSHSSLTAKVSQSSRDCAHSSRAADNTHTNRGPLLRAVVPDQCVRGETGWHVHAVTPTLPGPVNTLRLKFRWRCLGTGPSLAKLTLRLMHGASQVAWLSLGEAPRVTTSVRCVLSSRDHGAIVRAARYGDRYEIWRMCGPVAGTGGIIVDNLQISLDCARFAITSHALKKDKSVLF